MKEISLAGKAEINLDGPYTAEELEISVAGSGTINLNDRIEVDKLSTSLAGSSTINGKDLDVGTLECEVAGSGTYQLGGAAKKVSYEVAGKGRVKAYDLKAEDVSCEVAGFSKSATKVVRLSQQKGSSWHERQTDHLQPAFFLIPFDTFFQPAT